MSHIVNDKYARISKQTVAVSAGGTVKLGLWGRFNIYDGNSDVTLKADPAGVVTLSGPTFEGDWAFYTVAGVRADQSTKLLLVSRDPAAPAWDDITVTVGHRAVKSAAASLQPNGKYGGLGLCPAVVTLTAGLVEATGGRLNNKGKLKDGSDITLQGPPGGSMFDEHAAGLSLDIMVRDDRFGPTFAPEASFAAALFRIFYEFKDAMGWFTMIRSGVNYFPSAAPQKRDEDDHHEHIHLDWFDVSLATPPGHANRKRWTAIGVPDRANRRNFVTSAMRDKIKAAYDRTWGAGASAPADRLQPGEKLWD